MKKLILLTLFLTILCITIKSMILIFSTNTETIIQKVEGASITLSPTDKTQFALKMNIIYENDKENNLISEPSIEKINNLLLQIPLVEKKEKEAINAELAKYGVYEYEVSEITEPTPIVFTKNIDITPSMLAIYYAAWEASWTIVLGGYWNNDTWCNDAGHVCPFHSIDEVGDADTFGVTFIDNGNTYHSYVMRTSAYITDAEGKQINSTKNRSDGNGTLGFSYSLQDYIYQKGLYQKAYVGYVWTGLCTYDARFETFDGTAIAYYIHTYDVMQQ